MSPLPPTTLSPERFTQPGDVLALSGLAWKRRWTGTLVVQGEQGRVRIGIQGGGLIHEADAQLLQDLSGQRALFEFGVQEARGAWKALGAQLVALAQRDLSGLEWERVLLDLTPEEAVALDLPERLQQLAQLRGMSGDTVELTQAISRPQVLAALARLGFLRPAPDRDGGALAGLLGGRLGLDGWVGDQDMETWVGRVSFAPQESLLRELRLCAVQEQWELACAIVDDYVGPMDRADVAAWCALALLRRPSVPASVRILQAVRWSGLARRLPQSASSEGLLVDLAAEMDAVAFPSRAKLGRAQ